jgi:hypothetical protein
MRPAVERCKQAANRQPICKEMREELKGRNLTFTEIAKLVGENWQSLSQAEKEPFESQAQAMKDKFHSDLAEYKKTPEYRKYILYLQEFKAKHTIPSQGVYLNAGPLLHADCQSPIPALAIH